MGLQDYRCPSCGEPRFDISTTWVDVPEDRRDYKGQQERAPILCLACATPMEWIPLTAAHDLLSEGFIVDFGEGPRRISSLHEVRTIESQSLKDGKPIAFRRFSQDDSNRDRNTFKDSEYETNRQVRPTRRAGHGRLPIHGGAVREME